METHLARYVETLNTPHHPRKAKSQVQTPIVLSISTGVGTVVRCSTSFIMKQLWHCLLDAVVLPQLDHQVSDGTNELGDFCSTEYTVGAK